MLIQIAKTPSQTWAYEQYEIARMAFQQKLNVDALEYLGHAIHGHGSNTGYKIDFRFHFLEGIIKLGSIHNSDPAIIDLEAAEQAFLRAAQYAKHNYPTEAARACLSAGWAAYCQGRMREAEEYTTTATQLYREFSEAYFQLAKILMHVGRPNDARPHLVRAITLDRRYSVKALADDDFKKYEEDTLTIIDVLRQERGEEAARKLKKVVATAERLKSTSVGEFKLMDYAGKEMVEAFAVIEKATKAFEDGTLYGYLDANIHINEASSMFDGPLVTFLLNARELMSDIHTT